MYSTRENINEILCDSESHEDQINRLDSLVANTATDFLIWYKEAQHDDWIRGASNEEIYEQFILSR